MSREMDQKILRLYSVMPGAPELPEPSMAGYLYLGDIKDTKHWQFCAAIVETIQQEIEDDRASNHDGT
jgi:hypothetical protein